MRGAPRGFPGAQPTSPSPLADDKRKYERKQLNMDISTMDTSHTTKLSRSPWAACSSARSRSATRAPGRSRLWPDPRSTRAAPSPGNSWRRRGRARRRSRAPATRPAPAIRRDQRWARASPAFRAPDPASRSSTANSSGCGRRRRPGRRPFHLELEHRPRPRTCVEINQRVEFI